MTQGMRVGTGLVLGLFWALGCGSTQTGEAAGREGTSGTGGGELTKAATTRPAPTDGDRPSPGDAWVIFGADTVVAEVARTPDERAEGLMYREEVRDGTGMLFVFPDLGVRSFWMNNTYVALDIAYMDASFGVVDIQDMEPRTTTPHESAAPAMFALEVRRGWFQEHGIAPGDRAQVVFGLELGG